MIIIDNCDSRVNVTCIWMKNKFWGIFIKYIKSIIVNYNTIFNVFDKNNPKIYFLLKYYCTLHLSP